MCINFVQKNAFYISILDAFPIVYINLVDKTN